MTGEGKWGRMEKGWLIDTKLYINHSKELQCGVPGLVKDYRQCAVYVKHLENVFYLKKKDKYLKSKCEVLV